MVKYLYVNDDEGHRVKLMVIPGSIGGKFMKVWQGTGWEKRLNELQGNSMKVLWALVGRAGWGNTVPAVGELVKQIEMSQPQISRAFAELLKADFLVRRNKVYYLNPLFCWKGTDKGYDQAMRGLLSDSGKRLTEIVQQGERETEAYISKHRLLG